MLSNFLLSLCRVLHTDTKGMSLATGKSNVISTEVKYEGGLWGNGRVANPQMGEPASQLDLSQRREEGGGTGEKDIRRGNVSWTVNESTTNNDTSTMPNTLQNGIGLPSMPHNNLKKPENYEVS